MTGAGEPTQPGVATMLDVAGKLPEGCPQQRLLLLVADAWFEHGGPFYEFVHACYDDASRPALLDLLDAALDAVPQERATDGR